MPPKKEIWSQGITSVCLNICVCTTIYSSSYSNIYFKTPIHHSYSVYTGQTQAHILSVT